MKIYEKRQEIDWYADENRSLCNLPKKKIKQKNIINFQR